MSVHSPFQSIEQAIKDLQAGKMLIVTDDENRENEGDFLMAAEFITKEHVNFMASIGKGLICAPVSEAWAKKMHLIPMGSANQTPRHTAFTVSIDAAKDITTGISASDRAHTLKLMSSATVDRDDFITPGHIFPLIAKNGGVLERAGHTEATVDLMRLAGLKPVGVICEIMNEDGTMARLPDLMRMAKKFDLTFITIKDLIEYRQKLETTITLKEKVKLPTSYGDFDLYLFHPKYLGEQETAKAEQEIVVLVKGNLSKTPVLTRVHSECLTGDIFSSLRCDCGEQRNIALNLINEKGDGIFIYLRQEGRGIGLTNKIKSYRLQEEGFDTVEANLKLGLPADLRSYADAYQVLKFFGIKSIDLISNGPSKAQELAQFGISINQQIPTYSTLSPHNRSYLKTKSEKLGHSFPHLSW